MAISKQKELQDFKVGDIFQAQINGQWINAYYVADIIDDELIFEDMGEKFIGGTKDELIFAVAKKHSLSEEKLAKIKKYKSKYLNKYRCGSKQVLTDIINEGKLRLLDKGTLINELANEISLTLGDLS